MMSGQVFPAERLVVLNRRGSETGILVTDGLRVRLREEFATNRGSILEPMAGLRRDRLSSTGKWAGIP